MPNGWKIATSLALFSVLYNLGEGIVSLYFGTQDEALALAEFGGLPNQLRSYQHLGVSILQ